MMARTFDDGTKLERSMLNYTLEPNAYTERYHHSTPNTPIHKAPALNYSTNDRVVYTNDGDIDYGNSSMNYHGDVVDGMRNFSPNMDDIKRQNKNQRELDNFYSGKAKYKPNKGWRQR